MSLGGVWDQATWGPVAWFKHEGKPLEGLKKGCDPKNLYTLLLLILLRELLSEILSKLWGPKASNVRL